MLNTIFSDVLVRFFAGHFIGIIKALTIHREFAVVQWRDLFGAALRILALALLFVEAPGWLRVTVICLLALSFLLRVGEVVVTLFLARQPVPATSTATPAPPVELESTAAA